MKAKHFEIKSVTTEQPKTFRKLSKTTRHLENKLINLLSQSKGFKFVAKLVLEFKKIECDDITLHSTFYLNSKVILMIYLNWSIVLLYQT